ncbi:MAG: right-handed parallel beta-helix repeat-containing protein [Acidobacteriota bacterium]|nr:right-handed parallel beta-helix repeat-containing protein [Acidobacteriota bacterium]
MTEPAIPKSCAVVTAQLAAIDGNRTLAEGDEAKLDTARIQQALDGCPKGQAVELKPDGARNAFLSGPLDLRTGVALVVDANAILFGSRDPKVYEVRPGSCGIVDQSGRGCRALINGSGVAGAAVMGDGTIDGRGWAKVLGKNVSWWELAEEARKGGNQNCPRIAVLDRCDDFTLYRITLKNSANFHVSYRNGSGFTAWGVIINTPKTARNTDGIDPGPASDVTITRCYIHTGDDNVAIKAGGKCSHMTIAHNHFYTGHGMSIGSETNGGADTIRVSDLSIDGADNGIRIKSNSGKGGKVTDAVYEDVCIRDTKYPIFMDSDYAHYGKQGTKLPWFTGIVLRNVRVQGAGRVVLQGFDGAHPLGMEWDNVQFDSPAEIKVAAEFANLVFGPGAVNLPVSGPDVKVTGAPGQGAANACRDKFVPMPAR